MRDLMATLLILVTAFPVISVSAEESAKDVVQEQLSLRLRNMSADVERFLGWSSEVDRSRSADSESGRTLQEKLAIVPVKTKVEVILQNGPGLQGQLIEVTDASFILELQKERVDGKWRNVDKAERELTFGEVEEFTRLEAPKDWTSVEAVVNLAMNLEIEARLLNGDRKKGKLTAVTYEGFNLKTKKAFFRHGNAFYRFDEVEAVKGPGFNWTGLAIGVGVALGVSVGTVLILYATCEGNKC